MHSEIKELINDECSSMKLDEQRKLFHCKEGKNNDRLYVKRVEDGWLYNCFHCGNKGKVFDSKGESSYDFIKKKISRSIEREDREKDKVVNDVKLPVDFTTMIPMIGMDYLKKYFSIETIKLFNIGWSEKWNRVVFPLYHNSELVGVMYRKVYMNTEGAKVITYSKSTWDRFNYIKSSLPTREVVIVEDYVSGIMLNKLGSFNVIVLHGTSFTDKVFNFLSRNKSNWDLVVVWLDNDNGIVKLKQTEMCQRISLVLPCEVVYHGDPKRHIGVVK